jgi:transcriptional regulator with XRE-family HTH domain
MNENLKQIIKESGIKQEIIAKKLGITQGTFSQKLSKGDEIKYSFLLEISNILQISVINIITYPSIYVSEKEIKKECVQCSDKDRTIKNLNAHIELLNKKLLQKTENRKH